MFNHRQATLALLLVLHGVAAHAGDVKEMLKKADSYRVTSDALQVETEIKTYKSGNLDKERLYTVYTKPGRRSLVIMQSPSEKGQKLLMLADDFWQIMPQSQRPIRITPMQKLLGDASAGDIATLNWSEDYDGRVARDEVVNNIPCVVLDIAAQRKGVSYQRIELYLARENFEPVKAHLFVASDKMAKEARFTNEIIHGRLQTAKMVLTDKIQPVNETVVTYLSRKNQAIPEEYFNPMFLIRNDLKN